MRASSRTPLAVLLAIFGCAETGDADDAGRPRDAAPTDATTRDAAPPDAALLADAAPSDAGGAAPDAAPQLATIDDYVGVWHHLRRFPIVNTCPSPDSAFTDAGGYFIVERIDDSSARSRFCPRPDGIGCLDAETSTVTLHEGYALRGFVVEFDVPPHDCQLRQYTSTFLRVEGGRMTLLSVSDENVLGGTQCAELDAALRQPPGRDLPIDHCHVVEQSDLERQ